MDSNVKKRKATGSKQKSPPPPKEYSPAFGFLSLRTLILILLPLFSAAGFYGTFIVAGNNGTIKLLEALNKQATPTLPGSNDLQLRTYTGIGPIDRQLITMVSFFMPILDSKNGAAVLFTFFGFGQAGAAWTLMMMESMRQGNNGKIVSYIGIVGFIFQNITFAVTVPLWLFEHIITSPVAKSFPGSHASSALLVPSLDLKILPLTIVLGYIVPSLLMALPTPSMTSSTEHQQYIALWQLFPIWCVIIHTSLRFICNMVGGSSSKDGPQTALGTSYLRSAKEVYTFIISLCVTTHLPVLVLAILPSSAFPEIWPILRNLSAHSFPSIFIPYLPTFAHQVPSIAAGVHAFLQWDLYIGFTAMLLWGIFLNRNAKLEASLPSYKGLDAGKAETTWGSLLGKVTLWMLLAGPGGALALLLWERDTVVKQKTKQGI